MFLTKAAFILSINFHNISQYCNFDYLSSFHNKSFYFI